MMPGMLTPAVMATVIPKIGNLLTLMAYFADTTGRGAWRRKLGRKPLRKHGARRVKAKLACAAWLMCSTFGAMSEADALKTVGLIKLT